MKHFFPFILLSFSIFFLSFNATAAQTLIRETCQACCQRDPNLKFAFCTTSLDAAPASRCASLRGLGMIAIRLVRFNVTDARCHIKQLLKDKKIDAHVKPYLRDCLELYSDAIPSVKEAMKCYNSKKYLDANVQMSYVMDAATTCEDGFQEMKDGVSPLTKRNNDTFGLSAIALSIMHMLQTGSNY
ncbi:putative invertase inhibitor [Diospyros lotus]|uniref:putative invertase inhibitor n=1 Tax=Diospyros lotus TaxID=55363 RepID=UPI00225AF6E9|nr:putative invertase inhibitor [Diospyros lotus]